jgi:LacI family transcriptional regulator
MENIIKVALLLTTTRRYSRDLLRGIIHYSNIHGPWNFYREPPDYVKFDIGKRLSHLKKWGPDGIIARIVARDTESFEQILHIGVPTIFCSDEKYVTNDVPQIITNDYAIGRMAAKHLLSRGFRYFAYFGCAGTIWSKERCKGFSEKIKQAGYGDYLCENQAHTKNFQWDKIQDALSSWLESLPKPVGIMAGGGELALNIIEACKVSKLWIPEKVALITTDNDELIYELSYPPISSVAYDTPRAGYGSAELLSKIIDGKKVENKVISVEPTHVETRLSTDIISIEDQKVAKAIRFIRTNSKNNINVNKVLDHVFLSRGELNKRFKKYFNHTVHDEITRVRINEIISMLIKTNLPISEIAFKLDFPDSKHIYSYFQKHTNITPKAYRIKHRTAKSAHSK